MAVVKFIKKMLAIGVSNFFFVICISHYLLLPFYYDLVLKRTVHNIRRLSCFFSISECIHLYNNIDCSGTNAIVKRKRERRCYTNSHAILSHNE